MWARTYASPRPRGRRRPRRSAGRWPGPWRRRNRRKGRRRSRGSRSKRRPGTMDARDYSSRGAQSVGEVLRQVRPDLCDILKSMALPPGPHSPAALQAIRWIGDPFRAMDRHKARYGDSFTIRLPAAPRGMVLVSEPEIVKEVFALGPDDAHAGKANAILRPFLGKHSLLVLDGAEHLRQRKMMMPAFHGERMHAYGRTMMDLAHESIDRWPVGERFSVHRPMQRITLQVILRTVFGVAEGPRLSQLGRLLTTMLDAASWPALLFGFMQRDLGPFSPWGRFLRSARAASELLRGEIRRGREQGTAGRSDVLAMMLQTRDEADQPMSEDEVHDEL